MEQVECVVIGAGIVGLAIGRKLALQGREVLVLESESQVGTHASGRNSEVIHAGIYYPPGSLKARFCVAGKSLLYRYCHERAIPHKRLGKLIVATSDAELGVLQKYQATARANGVDDLVWLDQDAILEYEPEIRGVSALFSPSTGIIDSHSYMQSLQADLELAGGTIVFNTAVNRISQEDNSLIIETRGAGHYSIKCNSVINAAGLGAQQLAENTVGIDAKYIPRQQLVRGQYYSLTGRSPFRHLVYPVARADSLGIHVTLDLSGQARFGPDAQFIDSVDYTFDHSRMELFTTAIREYYPGLEIDRLQPGYTGIRTALTTAGPSSDFIIQGPTDHGIEGLVQLFGIESPGLTASLAIARYVESLLA